MKKEIKKILLISAIFSGIIINAALAYEIQDLTNVEINNDFVLGPGKIELTLAPGAKVIKEFTITNRLGKDMDFKVGVEDFKGSRDPEQVTVLMGEEKGPYSLRDYIKPEITQFTLKHGQRMVLPVQISIPQDAEPGGLYGAVLISTNPPQNLPQTEKDAAQTQMNIISRLGTLVFVRVEGDVKEEGLFKEIKTGKTDQKLYEKGPITFDLYYENNGNISLNPYGIIEIKNVLGKKIDEVEVKPFFAMPDSLRLREVRWDKTMLFGRYTATASINRGYQDIIDVKETAFWIIPWKIVAAGIVGLVLIIWFFKWVFGHFEFRKKKSL